MPVDEVKGKEWLETQQAQAIIQLVIVESRSVTGLLQ